MTYLYALKGIFFMDLIQFTLSIGTLVCCLGLFVCVLAFAALIWKSSRSTQLSDVNSYQKRFLFFFFVGSICTLIWSLTQTLLVFNLIPKSGILPVRVTGFFFIFTTILLLIYMCIQATRNRKTQW